MLRSQNHTTRKIGWNVELIAVDDEKRRRDCVNNKEIANEGEKRCTRGVKLWN